MGKNLATSTNNQSKRYVIGQCGSTTSSKCIQNALNVASSTQPLDMSYTTMSASSMNSAMYTTNNTYYYWHGPLN